MTLTKAQLNNQSTGETLVFLFNPEEYSRSKENSWKTTPGQRADAAGTRFAGGTPGWLSLQLFFDVLETGEDVRKYTGQLWEMAKECESRAQGGLKPPVCLFQWGPDESFLSVIVSLNIRFTLFREDGTPVRAVAAVIFQELEPERPAIRDGGAIRYSSRSRVVREKDTLSQIASEEYGDPSRWRVIAEANDIENPLLLTPGRILAIPSC